MAYVLGLLLSDGAIEDVRKSSRTCYIQITSKDKSLLEQVKLALSSNHHLYERQKHSSFIKGRPVHGSKIYNLRIGNKILFQDLVNLRIVPKKALRMKLPEIPNSFFGFFLRGYFDGDGSLGIYKQKDQTSLRFRLAFTSGCKKFLQDISREIYSLLQIKDRNIYYGSDAYQLRYGFKDGVEVLKYMYSNLHQAPYLERKYAIYQEALSIFPSNQG